MNKELIRVQALEKRKNTIIFVFFLILMLLFVASFVVFALGEEFIGDVGFVISVVLLAGFFVYKKNACPRCFKLWSMVEVSRDFKGTTVVSRNIPVTEYRHYNVDGKSHNVWETRYEKRYADANKYLCIEECKCCGFRRGVEKLSSK